jgi:hypothetical protein
MATSDCNVPPDQHLPAITMPQRLETRKRKAWSQFSRVTFHVFCFTSKVLQFLVAKKLFVQRSGRFVTVCAKCISAPDNRCNLRIPGACHAL